MKKILLALLLWLPAVLTNAQIVVMNDADLSKGIPCDKVRFRIAYDMNFVIDTLSRPYKPVKEPMILEVGNRVSLFYSYVTFHVDSVYAEDRAKGASQDKMNEHLNSMPMGKVQWKLFKNYPNKGICSLLEALGNNRYCCAEKIVFPDWKICADSVTMILGYQCHLATALYKGRKWSAWYAEDIPVGDGPWLLGGLPGLVLRAYDSQRQYVFEATGMEQMKKDIDILYKGEKYEPIERKVLHKLYARYYADPVGFITNNPNITVNIVDEHGNPAPHPKAIPYNPIER